jgi:hypothetical protein
MLGCWCGAESAHVTVSNKVLKTKTPLRAHRDS